MPFSGLPRTADGSLGSVYDGWAVDLYEQIPALTFPLSVQTYSRMRRDPQIAAVLKGYAYPLRSATYAVNPNGCRDEVVQFIADTWGLPISGDNSDPGPARRRGVQWDEYLRLALLTLPYGFSPFAKRYEIDGTPMRAKLIELSERLPQTISNIEVDDDGTLKGIYQFGQTSLIPAAHLLWNVREREGAAWQGTSLIREAYAPWLLKHEMWRVIAQSSRRFGMGVPTVTAPPGSPPADVTAAANIASGYRAGDQSGIGLPDGFKFDLTGLSGSVPDTLGFVQYLDAAIASSVLAEVLNLDSSPNGSRALGETVIGLLQMSWKASARDVTGPCTALNVEIVDNNWGEDEPVPAILCTDINRPEITSEAISQLITAGALTADLGLENDVRQRYSLPVIKEEDRTAARKPVVPPTPAPVPGGRTNEPAPEPASVP